MLLANFDADVPPHGEGPHTHGRIDKAASYDLSVVIIKNPYAWTHSIYSFMSTPITFHDFIFGTRMGRRWSIRTRDYVNDAKEIGGIVLKYEDMLVSTEAQLVRIAEKGIAPKDGRVHVLQQRMNKAQGQTVEPFDASYYTQKRYLLEYDSDMLAEINRTLDHDLMRELGYSREGR